MPQIDIGSIALPEGLGKALVEGLLARAEQQKGEPPKPATLEQIRMFIDQPLTPYPVGTKVQWRPEFAEPSPLFPDDFQAYVTTVLDKPIVEVKEGGWAERYDVLLAIAVPCRAKDCKVEHHLVEYPQDSRRLRPVE